MITHAPAEVVSLDQALLGRRAKVAAVGLGYVGLPLCVELAEAGFATLGYDLSKERVAKVAAGVSHIGHVPSERLRQAVAKKRLRASADPAILDEADVFVICVPASFARAKQPDLSHVLRAGEDIAPHVPELNQVPTPLRSVELTGEEMEAADCTVIVTDHSGLPYDELVARRRLIFDSRNALRDHAGPNIVRL